MKRNISLKATSSNSEWLAFFRIAVSVFCLIHFGTLLIDFQSYFSGNSLVNLEILNAGNERKFIPTIFDIYFKFKEHVSIDTVTGIFTTSYLISLFALALGFLTRGTAIFATLLHLIFVTSFSNFIYGVDCFCSIALFYCVLFPVGNEFSVDNYIGARFKKYPFRKKERKAAITRISLLLLQGNMCMAYFFGGFDKILGYNWWNGESIWKALHMYDRPHVFNLDFMAGTPLFIFLGWATIITEMCYPLFINIKRTRNIWLASIISMHLFIAVSMGLYFFSTFMIILNLSAYYIPFAEKREKVAKLKPAYK